jgi:hypothetical protein
VNTTAARWLLCAPSLQHDGRSRGAGASAFYREETTMKIAILCTTSLLQACSLSARAADAREQISDNP